MPARPFPIDFRPKRMVSLVPSMTESLFELGFGSEVAAVSDFCIYPKEPVSRLPKVGGPKGVKVEEVLKLHPDLVIANQEENDEHAVREIMAQGVPVWLTFPMTVNEAVADLWSLAGIFHSDLANQKIRWLEKVVDYTKMAAMVGPGFRYFCPIWQENHPKAGCWWMTFNQHTYTHDLLRMVGGWNVFGERDRRYPLEADLGLAPEEPGGGRDNRYPRVTLDEICQKAPEVALLPDEPYSFAEKDGSFLAEKIELAIGRKVKVLPIDGSLISWPGIRLARALTELPPLFS